MSKTQNEMVLSWLKGKHSITPLEALEKWGVLRLGARIYDLKRQGHTFIVERVEVFNRFGDKCNVARYTLTQR